MKPELWSAEEFLPLEVTPQDNFGGAPGSPEDVALIRDLMIRRDARATFKDLLMADVDLHRSRTWLAPGADDGPLQQADALARAFAA